MSRRQSLDRPGILSPPGPFLTPSPSPSISASPRLQPSPSLSPFPQDVFLVSNHSLTNATTHEQERKTVTPGRRQSIHQFAGSSPNTGTVVFQPSPSQSPAAATTLVGVTTGSINVVATSITNIGSLSTTQTTATGLDLNTTLVGSNNIQLNKKGTKRQQQQQHQQHQLQQQQQHQQQIFNKFGQHYTNNNSNNNNNNNNNNNSNSVVGTATSIVGGYGQSHVSTTNSSPNTFATTNVACSPKGQTKKTINNNNNGANNAANATVLSTNQLKQQQQQQLQSSHQSQYSHQLQQFNNNSPLIADSPSPTPNNAITAATIKPTTPQPMQNLATATTFTNNGTPNGGGGSGGHTFQLIRGPQGQIIAATTTTHPQQQQQLQQTQQRFNNSNINATLISNAGKSSKTPQQILPKPHQQQQQQQQIHMQANFETYPQQHSTAAHQITLAQQHSNQFNTAIIQSQQQQQQQPSQKAKNIATNNSNQNSTDNTLTQAMTHLTQTAQPAAQQTAQQQILIPSGSTTSLTATQQPLLLNQMPVLVQQNTPQGVQLILRPPTPQLTATPSLVIQNARPQSQLQAQQQPQQLLRILGTHGATMQLAAATPTFIVSSQANLLQQGTNIQTIKTNPQTPAITQISGLHAALSAAAAANSQTRSQQFTTTAATINGHILGPSMATHLQNLQLAAAAAAANGNGITAQIQMSNGLNSSNAPTLISQLPTAQFSQGTTQGLINFSQLSGTNLHQLAAAAAASGATTTFQTSTIPTQAPTNGNGNNTATTNTSNIMPDIFNASTSVNLTGITQSSPIHATVAALNPEPLRQSTPIPPNTSIAGSSTQAQPNGTHIHINLNTADATIQMQQHQQQQQQAQIHQLQQQIQQTQNQVQQAQRQTQVQVQQPQQQQQQPVATETTKKKPRPRKKKQTTNTIAAAAIATTTSTSSTVASMIPSNTLNINVNNRTNDVTTTSDVEKNINFQTVLETSGNMFNVATSMANQATSKTITSNMTVPYSLIANTTTSTATPATITSLNNITINHNSNNNNVSHGNATTAVTMPYNSQLSANLNIMNADYKMKQQQQQQQHSKTPSPPPQIIRASNGKLDLGNVMKLCGIMEDDDDCDDYTMDTTGLLSTTTSQMNDLNTNTAEISVSLPPSSEYQKIDPIQQPFTLTIPGCTTPTGATTNQINDDGNSTSNIVIKIDAADPNLGTNLTSTTPYSITIPSLPNFDGINAHIQKSSLKTPLMQTITSNNFSLPTTINQNSTGLLNGSTNSIGTTLGLSQSINTSSSGVGKTININQNSSATINLSTSNNAIENNTTVVSTATTSMATVKPRRKPAAKRNVKKQDALASTVISSVVPHPPIPSISTTITTAASVVNVSSATNININHNTISDSTNSNNCNRFTMTTASASNLVPSHIGNIQISQIDGSRLMQNNSNVLNAPLRITSTGIGGAGAGAGASVGSGGISIIDNKIQIMPILNKITSNGTTATPIINMQQQQQITTQTQAQTQSQVQASAQQQIVFQNNHANLGIHVASTTVATPSSTTNTLADTQTKQMQLVALSNTSSTNHAVMHNTSSLTGSLTINQTTTPPPTAATFPITQHTTAKSNQMQTQATSLTTGNVTVSMASQTSLTALIPQLTGSLSLAVSEHCERLILRHDPNQQQDQQSLLIMQALLKGALPNVTIINEPFRADNTTKLMTQTPIQAPLAQLPTTNVSSINNTAAITSNNTGAISKQTKKSTNINNAKTINMTTSTTITTNDKLSKTGINTKSNSNTNISMNAGHVGGMSQQQRYVALPRIDPNTQQLFCLNTLNNQITPIGPNQTTASIAPTERLLIAPAGINAQQLAQCLQQGQIHFNDANSQVEQTLTHTITAASTITTTTASTTLVPQQPKQQIVHPLSNNVTLSTTATITTTTTATTTTMATTTATTTTTTTTTTKQVANVAPIIDQSKTGSKQNVNLGNVNSATANINTNVPKKKPLRRPKASTTTAAEVALMKNATLVKPLPKLDPLSQKPNNNPVQIVPPNTASGKPVTTTQASTNSNLAANNTNVASVQPFQTTQVNNNGTKLIGITAPMQQQSQSTINMQQSQQQQQQQQTQQTQTNNLNIQARPQISHTSSNTVSSNLSNSMASLRCNNILPNGNGNLQNNWNNMLTNGPPSLITISQQQQQQNVSTNYYNQIDAATSSTSASIAINATTTNVSSATTMSQQNQQPQHTVSRVQTIQLTPQQQQMFRLVQMQIQYLTYKMQHKAIIASLPLPPEYDPNVIAPFNKAMTDYDINTALQRLFIEQQSILAAGKEIPTPEAFITNASAALSQQQQPSLQPTMTSAPVSASSSASSSSPPRTTTTNVNFISQNTTTNNSITNSNNNNNNISNNIIDNNITNTSSNMNLLHTPAKCNPSIMATNNTNNSNSGNSNNNNTNGNSVPNTSFQQLTQRIHIYPIQHQQHQQQQSQNKLNANRKVFQPQIATAVSTTTNNTIQTQTITVSTVSDPLMTSNVTTSTNYNLQQQIKINGKQNKISPACSGIIQQITPSSSSSSTSISISTTIAPSLGSLPALLQQNSAQFSQPPPLTAAPQSLQLSLSPLLQSTQGHGTNHAQMININNMPAILQQKHFTQHLQQQILQQQQQQQQQQKMQNIKPPLLTSLTQTTSFANVGLTGIGSLNSVTGLNVGHNPNNNSTTTNSNSNNNVNSNSNNVIGANTVNVGGPPPLIFPNSSVVLTQQSQPAVQSATLYQQQQQHHQQYQQQQATLQSLSQIPIQTTHLQQSSLSTMSTTSFATSLTITQKNSIATPINIIATTPTATTTSVNSNNYRNYNNNNNNNSNNNNNNSNNKSNNNSSNNNSVTTTTSTTKFTATPNYCLMNTTATTTTTTTTTVATTGTINLTTAIQDITTTTTVTTTQLTTLASRSIHRTTSLEGKTSIKTTNTFTTTYITTILTTATSTTTTTSSSSRMINNGTLNHPTVSINNTNSLNNINNGNNPIDKPTYTVVENSGAAITEIVGLKIEAPNPMSPKQKLARLSLFLRQLEVDQKSCLNADYKSPFQNKEEAVKRLIRYHCLYESDEDIPSDEENNFERMGLQFKDKFRLLTGKLQQVLLHESMLPHPTSELCQMEKLMVDDLKSEIEESRRLEKLLKEYETTELKYIKELPRNPEDTVYFKTENPSEDVKQFIECKEYKLKIDAAINDTTSFISETLNNTQQSIKSESTSKSDILIENVIKHDVKTETINDSDSLNAFENNTENILESNPKQYKKEPLQQITENHSTSQSLETLHMPLMKAAKKEDILNIWNVSPSISKDNESNHDTYSHLANATSEAFMTKACSSLPNGITQQQQQQQQQQQKQQNINVNEAVATSALTTTATTVATTTTPTIATVTTVTNNEDIKTDFENFDIESEITPSFIMKKVEPKRHQTQTINNSPTSELHHLNQSKENVGPLDEQSNNLLTENVANNCKEKITNENNEQLLQKQADIVCTKLSTTPTSTVETLPKTSLATTLSSNVVETNHFNFSGNMQHYYKQQQQQFQQRNNNNDDWLCIQKEFNLLNSDANSAVKKIGGFQIQLSSSPKPDSSNQYHSHDHSHNRSEMLTEKTLQFDGESTIVNQCTENNNSINRTDNINMRTELSSLRGQLNLVCNQEQQSQLSHTLNNEQSQHQHQHHNHHHHNENNELNEFFSGSEDSDIQKSVESRLEAMFSGSPVQATSTKTNSNDSDDIESNLESIFGKVTSNNAPTRTITKETTTTAETTLIKSVEHRIPHLNDKSKATWNAHNVANHSCMNHVDQQQPLEGKMAAITATAAIQQHHQIPEQMNTGTTTTTATTFINETINQHHYSSSHTSLSMQQQVSQMHNNENTIRWMQNVETHFSDFMSNGNRTINNNSNNIINNTINETSLPDCALTNNRKRHWNGNIIGTLNDISTIRENGDDDNGIPNRKLCSNTNNLTAAAVEAIKTIEIASSASSMSSLSTASSLSSSPMAQLTTAAAAASTSPPASASTSVTVMNHLSLPNDTSHAQDLMEAALLSLHDGLGVDTTINSVEQLSNHENHHNYENILLHSNSNNFVAYHNGGGEGAITRTAKISSVAPLERLSTNHFINNTNMNSSTLNLTHNSNNHNNDININNSILQQMNQHGTMNNTSITNGVSGVGEFDDDITRHVQNAIDSILNLQNTESGDSLSFALDHSMGSFLSDSILDDRQSAITSSGVGSGTTSLHELYKRRHLVDELHDCLMVNDNINTNHSNSVSTTENEALIDHQQQHQHHHHHHQHHHQHLHDPSPSHSQLIHHHQNQQHNHTANNVLIAATAAGTIVNGCNVNTATTTTISGATTVNTTATVHSLHHTINDFDCVINNMNIDDVAIKSTSAS